MSGDIVIDGNTTAEDLHNQIYDDNLDNYTAIYANLLEDFPEYEDVILEGLRFSFNVDFTQDGFIEFFNEQIALMYEALSEAAFPPDDEEIDPIFPEL